MPCKFITPLSKLSAVSPRISAHHVASTSLTNASVSSAGIDPTFDYLVSLMSPRFRISAAQYADYNEMVREYAKFGILTINSGFSGQTIYGAEWTNFQFRAWHDSAHLAVNGDFSRDGELRAMRYQIAQVWKLVGPSDVAKHRWSCILDAEILGQLDYFETHGEFVTDQRAFTVDYLARVHRLDVAKFPRTLDGLRIEY